MSEGSIFDEEDRGGGRGRTSPTTSSRSRTPGPVVNRSDPLRPPTRRDPAGSESADLSGLEDALKKMLRDNSGASLVERSLAEASLKEIDEGKTPGWVPDGKLRGNGFGVFDAIGLIPQALQATVQWRLDEEAKVLDTIQEREERTGVVWDPEGPLGDREITPEGEGYKRDGYSIYNYVKLPDWLVPDSKEQMVGSNPIRGRDLAPSIGGDLKVPLLGWNFPDVDSIIGLGIDVFGDPLNGLGKGGVALFGETSDLTIKVARQSKDTNSGLILQQFEKLNLEAQVAMSDSLPNILKAVREGNVSRAVRVARAGTGGFTINDLRSLGVQTNLTYYGKEIAGTESAAAFFGRFAMGVRRPTPGRKASGKASRSGEALARKMEGLKASSVEKYRTDMLSGGVLRGADGSMGTALPRSEWETFTTTQLNREAGNRVNGALMNEMADAARAYIDGTVLAKKIDSVPIDPNLKGKALLRAERKAVESNIPTISDEVINKLRNAGDLTTPENTTTLSGVYDYIGRYLVDKDMLVADMTPTTMKGFVNDETIPIATRMMTGPVVRALKAYDLSAMTKTKIADGVVSHSVNDLVGKGSDGVISRGAGTLRQMLGNVAILQVAESVLVTGRLQLGDALFNAADNMHAVIKNLGLDTAEDYLLKAGSRAFATADEAAIAREEVLDVIRSTKTPGGYDMPVAALQQLARTGSTLNLVENATATRVALAKTAEFYRQSWRSLEKFFDEIAKVGTDLNPKQGGRAFIYVNKQGTEAARRAVTQDPRTVLAKVRALVRNGWHNPDITNSDEVFSMFSSYDRAFLTGVNKKYPDMIREELSELSGWLREVEETASRHQTIDDTLGAGTEAAEFSKAIDTWYQDHTLTVRLFGPEAIDALNGQVVDGVMQPFKSRAAAQAVADRVIDFRVNVHGLPDQFGGMKLSKEGRKAYDDVEGALRGDFDVSELGTENFWVGQMLDSSDFLNRLGRADAGNDSLQMVVDFLSKGNRIFKSQATQQPGFFFRNFGGAAIMNYYRGGVVTEGAGGYRDWSEIWDTVRKAVGDEARNNRAPRTSRFWEEIGGRKSTYAGKEDLEMAQKIAYSGQIQSGGATGDPLDFLYDLDEATMGNKFVRGATQFTDRMGARNEATTVGLQRRMAERNISPQRVGDGTFNRTRYSRYDPEGLSSSARETTETYMRGAQMWSAMKKDGYGLNAALERVASTHFDYWDFTNAGKLAEIFMPFYLFRARMTAASVEMATSTPSMLTHIARLDRAMQEDRVTNPDKPYTIGAGMWRGMSMGIDVSDPRVTGLALPGSILNVFRNRETIGGFTREQVVGAFNPLLGFAYDTVTGGRTEFGELRLDGEEQMELIEGKPGFTPYLLRLAGVGDAAVSVLTEAIGAGERHPIMSMLERTGHFGEMGGELWGTDTGMKVISDMLPLLGQLEGATRLIPGLKGKWTKTEGGLTEAEWNLKVERQAWNSWASWFGFPVEFYSPDQEAGLIRSAQITLDRRNARNKEAWTMREALEKASFQEDAVETHSQRMMLNASFGD